MQRLNNYKEYFASCFNTSEAGLYKSFNEFLEQYKYFQNGKYKYCQAEIDSATLKLFRRFMEIIPTEPIPLPDKKPNGEDFFYKKDKSVYVYPISNYPINNVPSNCVVKIFGGSINYNFSSALDEIMKGFLLRASSKDIEIVYPLRIFKVYLSNTGDYHPLIIMEKLDTDLKGLIYELSSNYDSEIIVDLFMQIVTKLEYLQNNFGFLHNDLHTGNILIKKRNSEVINPYEYKNLKFNIRSKYIIKFADFGLSCINLLKCEDCIKITLDKNNSKCASKCYDLLFLFTIIIEDLYYYKDGADSSIAKKLNIPNYFDIEGYEGNFNFQRGEIKNLFLTIIYSLIFSSLTNEEKVNFTENYWLTLYRQRENYGKYILNPKHMKDMMFKILDYMNHNPNITQINLKTFIKDRRKICLMFLGGLVPEKEKDNINGIFWTNFFIQIANSEELREKYVVCIHNINETDNIPPYLLDIFSKIDHIVLTGKDHLKTAWGSISLMDSTLIMINKSYEKYPSIKKFVLVDKSTIPINNNPKYIFQELIKNDKSRIQLYGGEVIKDTKIKNDKYDYGFESDNSCMDDYTDRLSSKTLKKSSQWFVLDIDHARLILGMAYDKRSVKNSVTMFNRESDMIKIFSPKELYKIHTNMNKNFAIDELFMGTYILYQLYENYFYSDEYLEIAHDYIYDDKINKISPDKFVRKLKENLKLTDIVAFEYLTTLEISSNLEKINLRDFYLDIITECIKMPNYFNIPREYYDNLQNLDSKNLRKLLENKPIKLNNFISKRGYDVFIPPMAMDMDGNKIIKPKYFIKNYSILHETDTISNKFKNEYAYISQTYVHWGFFNILPQNVLRDIVLDINMTSIKTPTISNLLDQNTIDLIKSLNFDYILPEQFQDKNLKYLLESLGAKNFSAHPLEYFSCTSKQFVNAYAILLYLYLLSGGKRKEDMLGNLNDNYFNILVYWTEFLNTKTFYNSQNFDLLKNEENFSQECANIEISLESVANRREKFAGFIEGILPVSNSGLRYILPFYDEIRVVALAKKALFIRKITEMS